MKYSIQRKMFFISLITTTLSFALVLFCFNLLTDYHIQRQTMTELSRAVTATKPLNISIAPRTNLSFSKTITVPTSRPDDIARNLTATLKAQDAAAADVGFILPDTADPKVPAHIHSSSPPGSPQAAADGEAATALLGYTLRVDAATPVKAVLNNTSYYLVKADIADQTDVVFYKNIQPLEDLASQVNLVLLALLAVTGCLSVAVSMGLSRGMVRSIRKLCGFAEAVGAGDLTPRDLNLKEKELAVLGDDMNDMIRKLAAHDAEQKTFFQNVSHELRTPLMSIQGYAEGIADSVFTGKELYGAAEIILAESDRLTEMIGNLLYLSRMDSPDRGEKKEAFDWAEALEQAVEQVESLAAAKEIKLELTQATPSQPDSGIQPMDDADPFAAFGNRGDFQRAIRCILENTLRYAHSRVTVTLDPTARTIVISDDGPGIAEKDMPHIFRRFYKGAGGLSGIGLAIAQAAICGMGGTLTAENRGGACFTISLPNPPAACPWFPPTPPY